MWKKLSLRARLLLPMLSMVLAALVLGGFALEIVSPEQFEYENAQGLRSAKAVANALTAALATSADPQATLNAFTGELGKSEAIGFRPLGAAPGDPLVRVSDPTVPRWFIALLHVPTIGGLFPIFVGKERVGDIVFSPDLSADVFEKWIGFLAIVLSGSTLMLFAAASAYFTTGTAIRPLGQLQRGLTRLRIGDYDTLIDPSGPPEIRKSCEEANELAQTLKRLSQDNRHLLRKIVSVQDDERRELARELHDELGPLLFAMRANAVALSDNTGEPKPGSPSHGLLQAAEGVQQVNRRILEGLSPLYVQELGLRESIETLLRNARSQSANTTFTATIDSRLDDIDSLLSQTIYRVIQEGVTNVQRHAKATRVDVGVTLADDAIAIEIVDDGIGFAPENGFGRGLTGMSERVRALDGSLELLRDRGRTVVRCRLPLERGAIG